MINILSVELKRAIFNIKFLIAIIVGLGILLLGMLTNIEELNKLYSSQGGANAYFNWMDVMVRANRGYFSKIAPLLAALPFADSFIRDKNSGYIRSVLYRSNIKEYSYAKFTANGVCGGASIAIPSLIMYLICSVLYQNTLPPIIDGHIRVGYYPQGTAAFLFTSYPYLYILAMIILQFIFGFVYANIGFVISLFTEKRISAMLSPLLIFIALSILCEFFNVAWFNPEYQLMPWRTVNTNFFSTYGELIFIAGICFYYTVANCYKEQVY